MPRLFVFSLAAVGLMMGVALAHPARPLYLPAIAAKAPSPRPAMNLNGTTWQGKYLTSNRFFTFEPDGTLSYKSSPATKNSIKNRGHWRFDGDTLYFEHFMVVNNKLMEFRGKIQDANTIVGESITKTGAKTTQTLQRQH